MPVVTGQSTPAISFAQSPPNCGTQRISVRSGRARGMNQMHIRLARRPHRKGFDLHRRVHDDAARDGLVLDAGVAGRVAAIAKADHAKLTRERRRERGDTGLAVRESIVDLGLLRAPGKVFDPVH